MDPMQEKQNPGGNDKQGQQKIKKTIKRYQNRKLYDTHQSCYVTLDEIAEMISQGDDIVVLDNKSKKDITSSTMTQIIFEKQKKSKALLPISTLREIIQRGGGSISAFLDVAATGRSQSEAAKASLDKRFAETGDAAGVGEGIQQRVEDLNARIAELETKLRAAEAALVAANKPNRQPDLTH